MQDANRLREQVTEMKSNAETKAAVADRHYDAVTQRRIDVERDLTKFKYLQEVFTLGENLLVQRRQTLLSAETPPESHVVEGIQGALDELGRISRQAQDAVIRGEGAANALRSLEEAFREEQMQATSRARGLEVQGERAEGVAERRGEVLMGSGTSPVAIGSET